MKKRFLVIGIALAVMAGCSDDDGSGPPIGDTEVVTAPQVPRGPSVVTPGDEVLYTAVGATSSRGHPLGFRYDFDADGAGDLSDWDTLSVASRTWMEAGSRAIRAQARCRIHPNIVSPWSDPKPVEIGLGPDTEIFHIINTYFKGDQAFVEPVDFRDATPDTVPFGSWITVFYRGQLSSFADSSCTDTFGRCLKYQMRFSYVSERNPDIIANIGWRPIDPVDTNPAGVADSMSMNIGSLEYTVRARSVDQYGRPDPEPAEVEIIGNFDPFLNGLEVMGPDGEVIADGDTILWDWWTPADSSVDVGNQELVKRFYFVVTSSGRDHPKEQDGSGIKGWYYEFRHAADPDLKESLGRSDVWLDGEMLNTITDTVRWTARYPVGDWQGDAIFVDRPPSWNNQTLDLVIRGRDTSIFERFEQKMHYDGDAQIVNEFNTGRPGRWTSTLSRRFHLVLRR